MRLLFFFFILSLIISIYVFNENLFAQNNLEAVNTEFTEDFGGPKPGFRYKVRKLSIEDTGKNIYYAKKGGKYKITMEILHDCISCGNAINQIIVGLAGEEKAQISVWNGKMRSGGEVMVVNRGTDVECLCEDNSSEAEWVKVYFEIKVPDKAGVYYIRTRYSQGYTGNLLTEKGLKQKQKIYSEPLNWWKIDRPNGPGPESNIAAIIIEK